MKRHNLPPDSIAIVGMSGRFPGAENVAELWENLIKGANAISHFSENEIEATVATPEAIARGESFVRARGVLENAAYFDADFFDIAPREAELMDPQHRVFLECSWEALESAGHDPHSYSGAIAVFAGLSLNSYLLHNLGGVASAKLAANYQIGDYLAMLGNDKDFLPTRVAYKLNLRGPAMAVQCACSTSLVAIAQACASLQSFESDMALAGAVSITFPQKRDYRYESDGLASPDGVCRPFDADARGTVFSHGAAVLLLKRLEDAEADGNTILAVIRGAAVNNDGAEKIGYAAPSVTAQADVIAMAQANAGVEPSTISYVEAHGTGTRLGDPIEIAALTKAFREGGATANGFCAVGSAKGHIGHLDVASGATGVIKTVLQLQHEKIVPVLNFQKPNPEIDFENSPFFPASESIVWARGEVPRRAGVTAAGVGGTNAHVVVEEAPLGTPSTPSPGPHLLLLSAKTPSALRCMADRLADFLELHPQLDLADVSYTLAVGRRYFSFRRAVLVSDHPEAIKALRSDENESALGPAVAWFAGEIEDWSAHFRGQARRLVPLPTYPFERKKFWIEPGRVSVTEEAEPEPTKTESLGEAMRCLFKDLSGYEMTDDQATFEDIGLDSLLLTQVSIAIFSRFGVKVTFRQLLGELPNLSSLVAFVEKSKPSVTPSAPNRVASVRGSGLRVVKRPSASPESEAVSRFGPYRPMERSASGELTERQRAGLDELIDRYTRRTAASKAYAAQYRGSYADPRAVSGFQSLWKEMLYPIVSEHSRGSKIRDLDGNSYVDITMGFGAYFFGHSPAWLMDALEKQMHEGIEVGPQSPAAGPIARAICEITGMERATFCNTGSEAVMAGIRVARTVTARSRVAYFTGDYHGMFDEVLVRGAWVDGEYRAQPIAPGIPPSLIENMLVLDWADPGSLNILREHADELAAVIVEPVQSRRPGVQPRDFLRSVREITTRSGTALIFDEVVTGFRCHPGGAQAYFGIRADMATYGKVIGGGIPIGILAGSSKYLDALDGGAWRFGDASVPEVGMTFFAGTFVRHPLALAAAGAVIERLREAGPGLQLRMTERTARLCRMIEANFVAAGVPLRMPCFSAFAMIEHPADLRFVSLLWYHLRARGVHVWENRPIFLTLAHTDEDFDHVVRAFAESVSEMQEAGFLPARSDGLPGPISTSFPRYDSSPITEAQREILLAAQMGDDANQAFNESIALEFDGALDRGALEKSVLHILQRHPALRSRFCLETLEQIFDEAPEEFSLTERRGDELAEARRESTGIPFDLERGPLVRWVLVSVAKDRNVLIFSAHHLVCDGWSIGMIVDELSKSYNAIRAGRIPMLPPPMSFADYARDLAVRRTRGEFATDREYWLGVYQALPRDLDLPTDHPRPLVKSFRGSMESHELEPGVVQSLRGRSSELGGTLFSTLLSVCAVLLHRLTGQDDIVIGVPTAGQTVAGCDELVGHCLNLLPLRVNCRSGDVFTKFARDVRENVLNAYEHQGETFGSLLGALNVPRDPSRSPLVSVMFNIDRSGFDGLGFDGLEFRVATNAKQFVNFDLFFNLVDRGSGLEIECEYNTDLFDTATIQRWLRSFEALICGILEAPETKVERLPVLGKEELALLLADRVKTHQPFDSSVPVHTLVSKTAERFPDKPAVIFGSRHISYSELESVSNKVAASLIASGVRPGDLVGLCLERSEKMVPGLLGILKTGAAYVPMDPGFPPERLAGMREDSRMKIILAEDSTRAAVESSDVEVVTFNQCEMPADPEFVPSSVGGECPAYVIFTSGSTGRPKGVVVPHRALANFLLSMARDPGLSVDDTLLSVTTLSFDISGLEIFLPLIVGATVVIASKECQADGYLLADAIAAERVTVLQATPATWRLLLDAGWSGSPGLKALVGGEAVPRELVNRLGALCGSVWNVYGPTETTIWSTVGLQSVGDGLVSIGYPIHNTQLYIVNPALELQPVGVSGELLIGGAGVATGYLNQPELTAEKFVVGPVRDAGRVYRTGDLARRRADGSVECLGRIDDQMKVRGFRIEPAEIEGWLEKCPGVAQAVVREFSGRLVAYFRQATEPTNETELWKDQWELLFKSAIEEAGSGRLDALDAVITGWADIDDAGSQVEDWIRSTTERIAGLSPTKVYEIGCGTGQILARLAPSVERYVGSDIAENAVVALRERMAGPTIQILQRAADDFSEIPEAAFDLVIINSVTQYFPSEAYLERVLAGAAKRLDGNGKIFIGDVQSYSLMPVYHASSMAIRQTEGTTCGDLRERVARRIENETEFCLDPEWFERLRIPGLTHVEILLRRGALTNETTTYHYDAILHFGAVPEKVAINDWIDGRSLSRDSLRSILGSQNGVIAIRGIPDVRLTSPVAFYAALVAAPGDMPAPGIPTTESGMSAEDIYANAAEAGYCAHVRWQGEGTEGFLDAVFVPQNDRRVVDWGRHWTGYSLANVPKIRRSEVGTSSATDLRTFLAGKVPDYMIPMHFVEVESLPVSPNGKIDRQALHPPDLSTPRGDRMPVEPRTENEVKLLNIWRQVLDQSALGVEDDIFDLGGDSILIFQISARATAAGLPVRPATIFRERTVAAICRAIGVQESAPASKPIQKLKRDAYRRQA